MNILPDRFNAGVVGSGGRELMFAFKLNQSARVAKTFAMPGTDGFKEYVETLDVKANDFEGIKEAMLEKDIKLLIIGPEDPLVRGLADFVEDDYKLQRNEVRVLGFRRSAAMLEGSKLRSGLFCKEHGVPAPDFVVFSNLEKLKRHVKYAVEYPIVIKLDGLAAGKGVRVCESVKEAMDFLDEVATGKFGEAARYILVQDYVPGIEASVISFVSKTGQRIPTPIVQDYKPVKKGSIFMTGGMGGFAPNKILEEETVRISKEKITDRTIVGMFRDGILSSGILYAGIKTPSPKEVSLLEYNMRGGDPETETHLPLLGSDFASLVEAVLGGDIKSAGILWSHKISICLMLTSKGYGLPEGYKTGFPVTGLEEAKKTGVIVLPFGLKSDGKGGYVTDGGRCVALVAVEDTAKEAQRKVYKAAEEIVCENFDYRTDIGDELVKWEKENTIDII